MKIIKSSIFALLLLLACSALQAQPAIHKFEIWGDGTKMDKLSLYVGWSNGFLLSRGSRGAALSSCLNSMTYDQALAMIDKRYKDHPELWSEALGVEILEALTVDGGPCQGKNPLTPAH
ncbi:MAG: hypothetical protein ABSG54_07550 [Terriglobia bacterium]|jgi:hypothetical protein